jgi:hypothetical protein
MKSWLLKSFNLPGLFFFLSIALSIQSTFFERPPLRYVQPDFTLLLILWFALKRPFFEGGVLTLMAAYIAELGSASPRGVLLLAYMIHYLLTHWLSKLFTIPSFYTVVAWAGVSTVLHEFYVYTALLWAGGAEGFWSSQLLFVFPRALSECFATFWVFRFLNKFDLWTCKDPRAQQALETELQLDDDPVF